MDIPPIAFIGAGNMARSIVGGLVDSGHPAELISAADPFPDSLQRLGELAPIQLFADNVSATKNAGIVILAVKPQAMAEAVTSIAREVRASGALVVSIAAGITITSLQARLGPNAAIVRCMPNTPALLASGATAMFANDQVTDTQKVFAKAILDAVGSTCWVADESALDTVTALSGSGPAYFFLFMEAMIDAACEQGLDREIATALTLQTAIGSARMTLETDVDLKELRRRVTSPGGTTQAAIESFEHSDLRQLVRNAIKAAEDRAVEMAREMG
ncbi:MAG: pyrroline-5-carboxylate reductase [Pseudomonadota bacterium]